jgi:hypothetical protein
MGSRILRLTDGAQWVTDAGASGFGEAVEVLGFRSARLVLKVIGIKNPDSPYLRVRIQTSMDLNEKDAKNAAVVGVFTFTAGDGVVMAQTVTGLLRYVWWDAPDFEGEGADAFAFTLEGVVYD